MQSITGGEQSNPFGILAKLTDYAISAHANHPRTPINAVRRWDRTTPYWIHPSWCAYTILTESLLPQDIRVIGSQVLLLHDILEDTTAALPDYICPRVAELVEEMTFPGGTREEMEKVWQRSDLTILLKLYDKVNNAMDGAAFNDEKWASYIAYANKLADVVESKWGQLNILRIARAICIPRNGDDPSKQLR